MESQPNNSITEKSPEKELSQNQINKKSKIIIAISIGIAICAIIICIVVVVKTKKDDKDDKDDNEINTDTSRSIQSSSDYYISDEICESENVCYKLVNPNVEHYIFELSDSVDRTHVRYRNRYGIEIAGDLYTSKNINKKMKNIEVL